MTSYVITYRLVKGSPITEAEYDGSLHNLDDRVTVVEGVAGSNAYPTGFEIDTAGHLIVIMSNGAHIDAGPMPETGGIAASYRGLWQPTTLYHTNDLFTAPNSKWLGVVLHDHTSASSFDWGANDGLGHNYYAVLVSFSPNPTSVNNSSVSHTLTLDDVNTYQRMTAFHTAGLTVIIPPDSSVPIPVDSDIHFRQSSSSEIIFEPHTGVTLNYALDVEPHTDVEGAVVTLKKVGANEWDLFGRLHQTT